MPRACSYYPVGGAHLERRWPTSFFLRFFSSWLFSKYRLRRTCPAARRVGRGALLSLLYARCKSWAQNRKQAPSVVSALLPEQREEVAAVAAAYLKGEASVHDFAAKALHRVLLRLLVADHDLRNARTFCKRANRHPGARMVHKLAHTGASSSLHLNMVRRSALLCAKLSRCAVACAQAVLQPLVHAPKQPRRCVQQPRHPGRLSECAGTSDCTQRGQRSKASCGCSGFLGYQAG